MPTTAWPVSGCGSTLAFTTDELIVPSSRNVDTTTRPWSPAISRPKSSMSAMTATTRVERASFRTSGAVVPAAGLAAGGLALGGVAGIVEQAGAAQGVGHRAARRGRTTPALVGRSAPAAAAGGRSLLPRAATAGADAVPGGGRGRGVGRVRSG